MAAGLAAAERQLLVAGAAPAPLQVQMLPLRSRRRQQGEDCQGPGGRGSGGLDRPGNCSAFCTWAEAARPVIGKEPLAGGDLAVLVRTHREAELVRRALAKLNIASVYYSQDSVFATDEARQLHQLLAALLDLSDGAQVGNALVTDLFGLDAFALHALRRDQLRWGEMVAELAEYHQRWSRAGVMAMLHLCPAPAAGGPPACSPTSGGERKLTNFLHLAELLQAAAGRLPDG